MEMENVIFDELKQKNINWLKISQIAKKKWAENLPIDILGFKKNFINIIVSSNEKQTVNWFIKNFNDKEYYILPFYTLSLSNFKSLKYPNLNKILKFKTILIITDKNKYKKLSNFFDENDILYQKTLVKTNFNKISIENENERLHFNVDKLDQLKISKRLNSILNV